MPIAPRRKAPHAALDWDDDAAAVDAAAGAQSAPASASRAGWDVFWAGLADGGGRRPPAAPGGWAAVARAAPKLSVSVDSACRDLRPAAGQDNVAAAAALARTARLPARVLEGPRAVGGDGTCSEAVAGGGEACRSCEVDGDVLPAGRVGTMRLGLLRNMAAHRHSQAAAGVLPRQLET